MTKKRNISSSKKRVKKTNIKKRKLIKGGNKKTRKSKKNKKKTQKVATIKRNNKKTRKNQKGGDRKELLKTLLEKDKISINEQQIVQLHNIIENIGDFNPDNNLLKEKKEFVRKQIANVERRIYDIATNIIEKKLYMFFFYEKRKKLEGVIATYVRQFDNKEYNPYQHNYEDKLYDNLLAKIDKEPQSKNKQKKTKDKITELKKVIINDYIETGLSEALKLQYNKKKKELENFITDIALYRLKYEHMKPNLNSILTI
tara:strand:- start:4197 stop:4967 length:771 start_codon:yes stop_codon:yes gene_type:complete